MSAPLKDFRVPIPETTHLWLAADASAFGKDMQVIAREILNDWAKKKAKAYKVATAALRSNGLQMELIGDEEEEEGMARSGRK